MSSTRRQFLLTAGASVAAAAAFGYPAAAEPANLRILILGGTGFLGPACTESAIARGHRVTHFNSGRTEGRRRELGRPSLVPQGVEVLYGNRDPEKTADDRRNQGRPDPKPDPKSPKGLSRLEGRSWDAVIDTSAYFPRMVKASAELLGPKVKQYVLISTISVYRDTATPGFDETAPLVTLADPASEDMGRNMENYGGGKALCEKAAEKAMPGKVTVIRPGFIVGPRDTSGRFLYWPVRASIGGEMILPGEPTDPIQLIDVRDLADWIIHGIENNVTGTYNATGPAKEMSMKGMMEGIKDGVNSNVTCTWVKQAFLDREGVPAQQFPLYAPPSGETAGFHRCNIARALSKGLKFRPISDTARDSLGWYKSLPTDIQAPVVPQLRGTTTASQWVDREKELLARWHSEK